MVLLRGALKETNMIRNLGQVLSILVAQEAAEAVAHADVDLFHAPSECHRLVERHMERRRLEAVEEAERLAGVPLREIERQAAERGLPVISLKWDYAVSRVIARMEYPA